MTPGDEMGGVVLCGAGVGKESRMGVGAGQEDGGRIGGYK